MRISVIVPVKADSRLKRCLAALIAQDLPRAEFEVIVVDNGPDAFVRALAEQHSARYVVQLGGSYAARDRGSMVASGDLLAFTDADCVPPVDWLVTLSASFEDPACQVVIGPSSGTEHSTLSNWVQEVDEARWRRAMRAGRTAYLDARNLALRREVLARVPFDTSFTHAGDVDLGLRLFRHGIDIRLEPSLRLLHEHPRSLRALLRRGIRRGRGLARLERKHGTLFGPIAARPLRVFGRDVKEAVVRWGRRTRWVTVPAIGAAIAGSMGILWVLARIPGGEDRGRRPFEVFERLTLLLGRLTG